MHLLNGGLYPDLARPEPGQLALLDPERGPQVSARIMEALFLAGLKPTFAPDFDATADSTVMWLAMARADGHRISHRLVQFIADRARHGGRWTSALEQADVPLGFFWGMLDPVSGTHMALRIRERLPNAAFVALEDVAHWPALEAPEQLVATLLYL